MFSQHTNYYILRVWVRFFTTLYFFFSLVNVSGQSRWGEKKHIVPVVNKFRDSITPVLSKVIYQATGEDYFGNSYGEWKTLTDHTFESEHSRWEHYFIEKFSLYNPAADSLTIVIRQAGLQKLEIISGKNTLPVEVLTAKQIQKMQMNDFSEKSAFVISLLSGQTIHLKGYCKVYPVSPQTAPRLYHLIHWERSEQPLPGYLPQIMIYNDFARQKKQDVLNNAFWDGISFGALFISCIIALFLYFLTKDKAYVFYCLYVSFMGVYMWRDFEASVLDYDYTFLFTSWDETKIFYLTLIIMGYMWFIRYFLNTDQSAPFISKSIKILTGLLLLNLIADTVMGGNRYGSYLIYKNLRIFLSIISFAALVYLYLKKVRLSGIILLGSLSIIIGDFITSQTAGAISILAFRVGVFAELTMFVFGLAYRTRLVMDEKIQAIDSTRNRIAQDIHDDLGSEITRITYGAELAARMPSLTTEDYQSRLKIVAEQLRGVATHLREVLFAISPEGDSLNEVQAHLREKTFAFWPNGEVELVMDFPENDKNPVVSPEVKRQLLFIYKEIFQNIVKHAAATRIVFTLRYEPGERYFFEITDNGQGFVPATISTKTSRRGLTGMQTRAAKIGANLKIRSTPGKGTCIRVTGPLKGILDT
ncbi:MAG: 7TM diverse intracellular signaling domain-containing protein [Bacteroidia bacterium]|nr:7TM diverse intracellular signaling domain-containing protein [Bacteroidia bacterium]